MRNLITGLFLAGAFAFSLNAFGEELKIGGKMPEPRGKYYNQNFLLVSSDVRGVLETRFDAGMMIWKLMTNFNI